MKGVAKIVVKDLFELCHWPYLLIWLAIAPVLLAGIAGYVHNYDRSTRLVLLGRGGSADDDVRTLLGEIANISVVEPSNESADFVATMDSEGAELALIWHGAWSLYLRSAGKEQHDRLLFVAYQIVTAISSGRPWQFKGLGAAAGQNMANWVTVIPLSPSRRTDVSLVPSVIALLVVFLPFLLASNALVREQEAKTIEFLLVVPDVSWASLVIGKALLPVILGIAELLLLLVLSNLHFGTHLGSGVINTIVIESAAILASSLFGLSTAAWVRSELQAYLVAAGYFISLILLTGFIFPLQQAAPAIRFVSCIFPLTFSEDTLTRAMLYGADTTVFGRDLLWLVNQGVVFGLLSWIGFAIARERL